MNKKNKYFSIKSWILFDYFIIFLRTKNANIMLINEYMHAWDAITWFLVSDVTAAMLFDGI